MESHTPYDEVRHGILRTKLLGLRQDELLSIGVLDGESGEHLYEVGRD